MDSVAKEQTGANPVGGQLLDSSYTVDQLVAKVEKEVTATPVRLTATQARKSSLG